jgi:hypothetical protein
MGNIFSEKIKCSCGRLAVYRCRVNLEDYREREKFYHNHPEMEAYWRCTYFGSGEGNIRSDKGDTCSDKGNIRSGGGGIEESFVSCSVCVKEKHKPLFTHHPGGWVEEHDYSSYEEIRAL